MKSRKPLCKRFGKKIKKLRLERGWSQEELAHIVELDRSYLGALERGEQNPTLWIAARIAEAFEMTLSDLCVDV